MSEYDVIVVGAGPSGSATTLLLARAGHQVALFDRATFPRDKACGEGLMPPGVAVLRRLGLLESVLASGARRVDGVTYTDRTRRYSAQARFPRPPSGGDPWALGVRRTAFDATLVDAVRRQPGADLFQGALITGLTRERNGQITGVRTRHKQHTARVVVGADGLHSRVRAWAGLDAPVTAGSRYGLAGHWHCDVSGRRMIEVTFARAHEWYTAPVAAGTLLVSVLGRRPAFTTIAKNYAAVARSALHELRDAELDAAPLGAGLFVQRPRSVAEAGVFLTGDAAGYEDPTTGEGIGIGLELAERAASRIGMALRGEVSLAAAEAGYRSDHAALWRDRRRLVHLALFMARHTTLGGRAIARAARDPAALGKLLAVNCGYLALTDLRPRDWLSLAGF